MSQVICNTCLSPRRYDLNCAQVIVTIHSTSSCLIGIGGGLTTSPLPHHRTFGSRIRRFGRLSLLSGAKALAGSSPRQPHARSGNLPCERPVTGLYDRSGLPCVAAGTMPSADSSHGVRKDYSSLSQFPWHATFRGTWEASRGKRSYCRCIDAGFIKHSPVVDGGLHGRVPARPDGTTPCIRCVSLAPHLRSTLPSDAPSRRHPCASLVLRLHAHLDRRLSLPSMTACTAHTLAVSGGRNAPAFWPSAPVPL